MNDDKEKTREDKSKSGIISEQLLKDKANKYNIKANEEGRRDEGHIQKKRYKQQTVRIISLYLLMKADILFTRMCFEYCKPSHLA